MAQNFRQGEILAIARKEGKVVVEDVAARFSVTQQTIRRDLGELCESGHLSRVYGGAVLPSGVTNIGYEERRQLNPDAKARIARACAREIPDNASVFLAIGTSTEAVAQELLAHRNLMVVTNNINVANVLAANPDCEVIVAGGVLRRADGGLVGDATAAAMAEFKVDIAVIGASAMDAEGDLLDYDYREVRVTRAVLRGARRGFLVADSSKFARTAPVRIASLEQLDTFFTETAPPEGIPRLCSAWGTTITIA